MLLAVSAACRLLMKKSYGGEEKYLDVNSGGSEGALLEMVRSVVPQNDDGSSQQEHRIGTIGGYKENMGRPYFTALSALKLGCDYSHVFCDRDALVTTNPEILFHSILESPKLVEQMYEWLPRLAVLVVGPGMGRDLKILENVRVVLDRAKQLGLPIIFDSFGILLIKQWPEIIYNYQNATLITSCTEFNFLYKNALGREPADSVPTLRLVAELALKLGGVTTMVNSGQHLLISNGHSCLFIEGDDSVRKIGRWADILTGLTATFTAWAFAKEKSLGRNGKLGCVCWNSWGGCSSRLVEYSAPMTACYGAGLLATTLAQLTFQKYGHQNTATNMIEHIHQAFTLLFQQNDDEDDEDEDDD